MAKFDDFGLNDFQGLLSKEELEKLQDDLKHLDTKLTEQVFSNTERSITQGKEIEELLKQQQNISFGFDMSEIEKLEKMQSSMKSLTKEIEPANVQKTEEKAEEPSKEIKISAFEKLEQLIGLENIKLDVKELTERLQGQRKLAKDSSIKISPPTLHMIFSGPPGTGKTEVARLYGELLHELGFLPTKKLIETDRSGLVGQYEGQTAQKTMAKINEAMGGVLFIDEAYSLANGEGNNFGKEAIDTLIKATEDNRDGFALILAGYDADMNRLLETNPGFRSRIPNEFKFKDYTSNELTQIAKMMLSSKGYKCEDIMDEIDSYIQRESKNGGIEGNGRWVRNFVDRIVKHHMIRIGKSEVEDKSVVLKEDVQSAIGDSRASLERSGMKEIKEEGLKKLDALVGLENVKSEMKRFMSFLTVQRMKYQQGKTSNKPSMNMVFSGPTGTGKTTLGKIIAQILKGSGVLSNGQLLEVSRADLVGAYQGQTAKVTKDIVSRAAGGVLFIDEAQTLNDDSYGKEAINTLVQGMEKYDSDLVVILCGDKEEIQNMLSENPILQTRIAYNFDFPNYSPQEVFEMVKIQTTDSHLILNDEAQVVLLSELQGLAAENLGIIEGNGRWVETFIDKLQISQSVRIMEEGNEDLETITKEDILDTLKYL